ncbi:MAG: hypothetical protein IJV62_01345 [Eggerthellaceae bacterium]|nr:hypothetical protein [Eggerthellaceae bacterium]
MKNVFARMGVSLVSALALACTIAFPAFAQDTYTAVSGDADVITIEKTLDLNDADFGPAHTATFSVTGGTNTQDSANNATGNVPDVVLSFGTTDTSQSGGIDFSGVTFPAPGIYTYTLTETAISNPAVTPVDPKTYVIDVYVDNVTTATGVSELQVTDYVLHESGSDAVIKEDTAAFENEYNSFKLDVEKQVTGNQGNKTKEFTITVTFANGVPGDSYAVKVLAGTPKINGQAASGNVPVAANSAVVLTMKDTDKVEFFGIPAGVTYTVVETESNQDGYTTTGEVTTAKELTADASETVVNDKSGTVPTGIFINNMPYFVMAALAIVLALVFVRKRNNRLGDDL